MEEQLKELVEMNKKILFELEQANQRYDALERRFTELESNTAARMTLLREANEDVNELFDLIQNKQLNERVTTLENKLKE